MILTTHEMAVLRGVDGTKRSKSAAVASAYQLMAMDKRLDLFVAGATFDKLRQDRMITQEDDGSFVVSKRGHDAMRETAYKLRLLAEGIF